MSWLAWARKPAAIVAAVYCLLVVAYALATPLYESTDEIRHFRYLRYLQTYHALPVQTADASRNAQAHHPPLYYLVAAAASAWVPTGPNDPVFFDPPINPFWGYRYFEVGVDNKAQYLHGPEEAWPGGGNVLIAHVARLVSALFGLGVVLVTYRLGRTAFPERPALALGAAAFVAFNPNFLHLAASINNDVPAAFFGALALLASARILRHGSSRREAVFLGVALGLGLLTKTNTAALLLPGLLAVGLRALQDCKRRQGVEAALIVIGWLLALNAWWFVRNQVRYGDFTGTANYVAVWRGEADQARLIREMVSNLPYAWTTVWGRFGYGQVPLPDWAVQAGGALVAVAALGWAVGARRASSSSGGEPARQWAVLGVAVLAAVAAWVALMVTIPATGNARMIFDVYPALGLLVAGGLAGWAGLVPQGHRPVAERAAAVILAALSLGLALFALFGILRPAFARPRLLPEPALSQQATPVDATLGNVAQMVGYRVWAVEGLSGEAVNLTVYWRPLAKTAAPWTVFIHLLDDNGIPIAQRQTYPGLGNYPTTVWQPGGLFADTYRVLIPDTAYAPDHGQWQIGLFDLNTSERLAVFDASGAQVGDSVSLAAFDLLARPGPAPNAAQVNFDGRIELRGYEIDRRTVAPGQAVQITTYWRGLDIDSDYWAYAHVVGVDGSIWANSDSVIVPAAMTWPTGEMVSETRSLRLAPDTPPGLYEIELGVTRVDDGGQHRLSILAEDGHEVADHLILTTIRVGGN